MHKFASASAMVQRAGPDHELARELAYACQIMSATVLPAGMNGSTCSV
jgi:hypothetical protein